MKLIKFFLHFFLIFTISLIAENQLNQKKIKQQQKSVQKNQSVAKTDQSVSKKVFFPNKQKKSRSQTQPKKSHNNVYNLIENFIKSIEAIPVKELDLTDKKTVDGKEYARVKNIKEYRNAVDKAYESYKELYKEKDNQSISDEQHKQIKHGTIKLFDSKNIQNMVWPKEKMMKASDEKETDKK